MDDQTSAPVKVSMANAARRMKKPKKSCTCRADFDLDYVFDDGEQYNIIAELLEWPWGLRTS